MDHLERKSPWVFLIWGFVFEMNDIYELRYFRNRDHDDRRYIPNMEEKKLPVTNLLNQIC